MKRFLHDCVLWAVTIVLVANTIQGNTKFSAAAFQPGHTGLKVSPINTSTRIAFVVGKNGSLSWSKLRSDANGGEPAESSPKPARAPLNIAGLGAPAKRVAPPPPIEEYDIMAVRAVVQKYIDTESVLMFRTSTCRFCDRVNQLFTEKVGTDQFRTVDISDRPDMRAELAVISGRTSVPAVFIKGEFVGGANDGGIGGVVPLNGSGELDRLLTQAGVTLL